MSDIAIKFENISKQYRLGKIGTGTLSHDLKRWWTVSVRRREDPYLKIGSVNDRSTKADSEYVWALRDINLEVKQGEVLGIIGKNGAGKSTLLKLLSRVTTPTTGRILSTGRIASLLEVGTGFHPEMTGRENIHMNGSIMGMSKAEVTRKFDEIVDFAGVAKYIDTPVKRYSSGMTVRLGFAIAAHLEPEILVVDEVLAVGDAEFQKKAVGKMQSVSKQNARTVLFVSHNMDSIINICDHCILFNNGSINKYGPVEEVVDYYLKSSRNEQDVNDVVISSIHRRKRCMGNIEYTRIRRYSERYLAINEPLVINLEFRKNDNDKSSARIIGIINHATGVRVGLFFSGIIDLSKQMDIFNITLKVNNTNLAVGSYYLDFSLSEGDITSSLSDIDLIYNTITFEVKYLDSIEKKHISYWQPQWGKNCYLDVEFL